VKKWRTKKIPRGGRGDYGGGGGGGGKTTQYTDANYIRKIGKSTLRR